MSDQQGAPVEDAEIAEIREEWQDYAAKRTQYKDLTTMEVAYLDRTGVILNTLSDAKREIAELDCKWHIERRAHLDYYEMANGYGAQRDELTKLVNQLKQQLSDAATRQRELEAELQREKERADAGYEAYAATDEQLGKLQAQLLAVTNERNEPCSCCRERGCNDGCRCDTAAGEAPAEGE